VFERITVQNKTSSTERDLLSLTAVASLLLLGETLILFQYGDFGLVLHAVTIVVLVVLVNRNTEPAALLYQSLLLLPVLRIFNLGLPIFTHDALVFLGVIYTFLLLSTWLIVRSQDLSIETLGLGQEELPLAIPGIFIGLVLGVAQYFLGLEELAYQPTLRNYVLVVITTGLLVGLVEELIFRGLVQRWMDAVLGRWPAILGVSLLFGFMHSVWLAPMNIVFAGTVSIFLGWAYAETNNLWFITSIHAMINVAGFLLAPLVFA